MKRSQLNTFEPLVSVLMTSYNREKYIAQAIESVLASIYKNIELIIVDDGSIDTTVQIIKNFTIKDSRIRFYINEKNLGDYSNRNRAASYANGDFMLYTDSDDELYEYTIQKYIAYLKYYPSLNFAIFSAAGEKEVGNNEPYIIDSKTAVIDHYFKKSSLLSGPGGIFVRKVFFEAIGKFPEKYGPANDMYFNVKAASFSDVLIIPFTPIFYRKHDNQESNNMFSYIYNNYRYNKDLITEIELPLSLKQKKYILKKNKRRFVVNALRYLRNTKNFKKTFELFKKAEFNVIDAFAGIFH